MNLSPNGASVADKKLSPEASLNPNAAEFVPFALRSQAASVIIADRSPKFAGKSILDRSESSVSNNSTSEEEAQQFWCHQLPDDLTPDFKVSGIDNEINGLPFSNLSLNGVNEASRYTSPTNGGFTLKQQQAFPYHLVDGIRRAEKVRYPVSSNEECFQTSLAQPWEKQIRGGDQVLARKGNPYNGNSSQAFLTDMAKEQLLLDNADLCRLELLASQFPSFAAESIADAYLSNGGDLNLTINMLMQLELRVDGSLNQTLSPKTYSTPNLPTLRVPNGHSCNEQNVSPYWSSAKDSSLRLRSSATIPSRVSTDFASAARKMASQENSIWKYDINRSSGTRQVLASAYNSGQAKSIYGDRLQSRGSPLTSPARLETGASVGNIFEAINLTSFCLVYVLSLCRDGSKYVCALCMYFVLKSCIVPMYMCFNSVEMAANMYAEKREEARDHVRVHNAYFEQAQQAYLVGNKMLAKELSLLGQVHNLQMKAAQEKAQESIYHQRNSDIQSNGTEQMIDLHGLNVNDAIFVLKRELAVLRNAARSVDQHVLVSICVGAGYHIRDSPMPARLPVAVKRYLLEEEGLDYSEPQPGLLRVVIY